MSSVSPLGAGAGETVQPVADDAVVQSDGAEASQRVETADVDSLEAASGASVTTAGNPADSPAPQPPESESGNIFSTLGSVFGAFAKLFDGPMGHAILGIGAAISTIGWNGGFGLGTVFGAIGAIVQLTKAIKILTDPANGDMGERFQKAMGPLALGLLYVGAAVFFAPAVAFPAIIGVYTGESAEARRRANLGLDPLETQTRDAPESLEEVLEEEQADVQLSETALAAARDVELNFAEAFGDRASAEAYVEALHLLKEELDALAEGANRDELERLLNGYLGSLNEVAGEVNRDRMIADPEFDIPTDPEVYAWLAENLIEKLGDLTPASIRLLT
ncbi:MAG: hypothetical protein AAF658_20800, partial [Myxococcota bacterium]